MFGIESLDEEFERAAEVVRTGSPPLCESHSPLFLTSNLFESCVPLIICLFRTLILNILRVSFLDGAEERA